MIRRRNPLSLPSPAAALDDDDLLQEILLRLPPSPSSLPRAAAVCKRWRGIVLDDETGLFPRRFRAHHHRRQQPPPLLGFFVRKENRLSFVPTLDPPDRIPAARFPSPPPPQIPDPCRLIGFRHGLAFFFSWWARQAILWDPLTGRLRRVSFPSSPLMHDDGSAWTRLVNAAAVCTAAAGDVGHVHGACLLSPFKLVLVGHDDGFERAFACVYETESGEWGDVASVRADAMIAPFKKSVLVGNKLYWLLFEGSILEFDLESQGLVVIKKPTGAYCTNFCEHFQILRTENNGIGLAFCSELNIQIWERKSNSEAVVEWVLQKDVQLDELLPPRLDALNRPAWVLGYDEGTNVIFLSMCRGVFMVQLNSMKFTDISKICHGGYDTYYPYTNFYTTGGGIGGGDGGTDMSNDT